ncbi:MAG: TraB/GumN family protein [Chlorobi bacterium]|nr:MAG: TraB family protein [Chlorobi bacterium OLB7]MBK8912111.1 TraB/GumN family protein [Chlorobiota bacterium]MBX7217114.1 TraB/GumN family protein [Candidatus Kapabacteria bacterium]
MSQQSHTKIFFGRTAILAAAFLLAAGVALRAQDTPRKQSPRHCLWKVSSPTNTIYLLGSIHLLKEDIYPLDTVIESAINQAEVYAFEADLDSFDQDAIAGLMLSKGMYTGEKTLKNSIAKSTYQKVAKALEKQGLAITLFNKFKPWVVALTIMGLQLKEAEMKAEHGIDKYVHGKAEERGKPTAALEAVTDQINLFSSLNDAAQESFLKQSLDGASHGKAAKDVNTIVKAWQKGDLKSLEKLLQKTYKSDPEFYKRAVTDRNHNWMPKIEEFLAGTQPHLVTVGALHLVGKEGVVELLRAKGYSVQQL